MQKASYLIIGGGPAGLTMAKMLMDRGVEKVTILEAADKVGGKCLSDAIDDHVVEFGTCYAIWSHRYILKQMKKLGIKRNYLKAQRIDDRELLDYIRAGSGPNFIWQVLKYAWLRHRLIARADKGDPRVNEILAIPAKDWLDYHQLGKIEHMMHRVVTSIGYGYLTRVPLIHAMRWVDIDMLITGLLKFTVMPDRGWQNFWDRFAESLTVKLSDPAKRVIRDQRGVTVETEKGGIYQADYLINTIPMDRFAALTHPTAAEQTVADSVDWAGYTTTLMSVEAWPHSAPVNAWSDTCSSDAKDGQLLFSRYECEGEDGRPLFSVGQSSKLYTPTELRELAEFSAEERGAVNPQIIRQKIWSYMPTYKRESIQSGLLQMMQEMQGEARTYHTGSTFSHEAISTISAFNSRLISQVIS
ncbi:MAG: FAD-dependent oxidoreductase [Pseudomonadota bacterium]